MNTTEEDCSKMINCFRVNELQLLLGTFYNRPYGRKITLRDQALALLRNKPANLNYEAYVAKIIEIYNINRADVGKRNMKQNQKQQRMPNSLPQAHSLNLRQQPHQYPQQSMNIQQLGSSKVNLNKQGNTSATNHLTYDTNNVKSFVPSAQSLAKIKLKKLPFYEFVSEILKPSILIGNTKCSLSAFPEGTREELFKFTLSAEQATDVAMNRDISNGKHEYLYQIIIRCCLFEPDSSELTDFLPIGLHIRFGFQFCPLPPASKPGAEARRAGQPIHCTELVKLSPCVTNKITVNWIPDAKIYVMGVYLVKKLTPLILLEKLMNKKPRSSEETKNYIIQKFADVDPDLTTTSYRVSIVCPLGKVRMKVPAKSIKCDHLQCFDAGTFILMNEKRSSWMCPICNQVCLYDDIQIESYFLEVVSSPNIPENCEEIELLADGTWKVYEENIDLVETSADSKEKPLDCINLDSDEENVMEVKKEQKNSSKSSESSQNLKSYLIDLTLSDNDEPTIEKGKQENEAQAANSIQPAIEVDVQPSALVQPQQAVTSSELGMIIEIDSSPSPPSSPMPTTMAS